MTTTWASIEAAIAENDERLASLGEQLAADFKDKDPAAQLKKLASAAMETSSWKAFEIYVRYQAARNYLGAQWAEDALREIEKATPGMDSPTRMRMAARCFGYAARSAKYLESTRRSY